MLTYLNKNVIRYQQTTYLVVFRFRNMINEKCDDTSTTILFSKYVYQWMKFVLIYNK